MMMGGDTSNAATAEQVERFPSGTITLSTAGPSYLALWRLGCLWPLFMCIFELSEDYYLARK
jgi:hypothetical protein